ncbi:hypothetical protein HYG87_09565 [Methanobacterium alkalithermotolerans]|uniref:Uncharacterized protein n=1 Tax=Methanobacterium alkalithermotolerans TaxID=2731220 RepID=A0A8T8K5X4_9EURY|nr:hypothetical protein [Methanobacterium alkalithermotolerans]QUH23986.1 hypothetical protein HYG87_09565 [Methanobacterium alkalithermotolerans]
MISDLIEFGKWLNDNKQDDFGKNVKENDYILDINFDKELNSFNLGKITQMKEYEPHYSKNSIFHDVFFITTDQKFMIPSKSNLLGLTPFFIKIDHDFKTRGEIDEKKLKRFYGKIERSKKSNEGLKEFNAVIKKIYDDIEKYLGSIGINDNQRILLESFFMEYPFEYIEKIINDYYSFLFQNKNIILNIINEFKGTDKYAKKSGGNFYLACYSNLNVDLINDVLYYYSKFIKKRKESFQEYENGICAFCNNIGIVYPSIGSYSIGNPSYSFNYDKNEKTAVKNSRLRFCKICATYSMFAEDKLKKIQANNIFIIPKRINGNYKDFLMISNKEINSFEKINEFMDKTDGFNYDLVVYTLEQGDRYDIKKYIENYNAYRAKFKNINLYENNKLPYLLDQPFKKGKNEKSEIKDIFDLEFIFKQFFIKIEDEKIDLSKKFYHFYEIYTNKLTGKTGILYRFDTKTVSIFAKYMHNIFNLIYELNEDALNKNMLNEIVFNSLIKLQKHNNLNKKNPRGSFYFDILRRLNYYFMLKKELLGDEMLKEGSVKKLKEIGLKYNMDSELEKIAVDDSNFILETIENDPALKYYIIGQFLGLIDGSKRTKNKKAEVFSNFVTNANRNNVRNLFVTEVLQKNNYYIEKMNKKGKFMFKLFEKDMNSLFNESDGFSFEDYLLLIFTGYYTENALSSVYGTEKMEDDKDE